MTPAKIREEIADYEALLEEPSVPADEKALAKEQIAELKKKLEAAEKKPAAKSDKPKKAEKPAGEKKETRGRKKKEKTEKPTPTCDELIEAWEKRREAAKKNARKAKTRSVMSTISDKVEGAVVKAIKNVDSDDLKKNPEKHFEKFDKLESSMKEFLTDFKSVLGDEYESKEVTEAVNAINELIKKLKDKYIKK